ncbi:MAG: hypothetical protein R3Y35_13120 [Clostridia bacterium]
MSYNTKTDYVINKMQPNRIIYSPVTEETHYFELKGEIVTEYYVNLAYPEESYTRICDEVSVDEFKRLKKFSDDTYHDDEKQNAINANVKRLIKNNTPIIKTKEFSLEEAYDDFERSENFAIERENNLKIISEILKSLTEIQRKRFLMHVVEKKSTYKIAEDEKVSHQAVCDSIEQAKKKIKKYFKKSAKTTC